MAHPTDDRNFRLPASPRPLRYVAQLELDVDARRFAGQLAIELEIGAPADEIVLHAVDLAISRAELRSGGGLQAARSMQVAPASQTVRVLLPAPAGPGRATLELAWTGEMSRGLRGLYRAGEVAVTQFEAADARRVFPCFDEPAFKAPWALTVDAPAGLALLSNGAPAGSSGASPGRQRITFSETPPLPTYLVALACGKLVAADAVSVRGVPVRTWAVPHKANLAAFGQEVAVEVLPRLEDYFGLPYAFGKLDQVAVPDFEAGAMENAGLVTFREAALLLDPATASMAVKKRVAEVVTHELAHQWFGNWVTMRWWDDLWLNEAFATWMAFKIVDAFKPEWRVWLDFNNGKAAALHLDALRSTHPIHAEVKNPDDMTESFDVITYEKGGAVLRMIEGYLGEAPFRDGIRLYMRRHARANAVADDLWSALAERSRQPVLEVANAWIRQPGHPVVEVRRDGKRLQLSQRRFFSEPGAAATMERWPVPLVLRYEDASGVREQRHLLRGEREAIELEVDGDVRWLCANAGSTGFYRVAYDAAGVAALAASVASLRPAERIGLLADEWALVRAGVRDVGGFLDLAAAFAGEQDYAVLDELVGRLGAIEARLLDRGIAARFRRFVADLLGPGLEAMGWDAAPGEGDPARLRRAALVRAVGLVARDERALDQARARLGRFLSGDAGALEPNLHEAAVVMASRAGDAALFDLLRARFPVEPDPAFQRRYLVGLAHFEDAELAARARELAFAGEVPLQDTAFFVAGLLANRTGRDLSWRTLRDRWGAVEGRVGGAPMLLRRIVEAVGLLPERRHLDEAAAFFAAHPVASARQAIAQTLERMRQDVALWERAERGVGAWLDRSSEGR